MVSGCRWTAYTMTHFRILAGMVQKQINKVMGVPFTPSYSRIRLGDRMVGVSYALLSSAPLVFIARQHTAADARY